MRCRQRKNNGKLPAVNITQVVSHHVGPPRIENVSYPFVVYIDCTSAFVDQLRLLELESFYCQHRATLQLSFMVLVHNYHNYQKTGAL